MTVIKTILKVLKPTIAYRENKLKFVVQKVNKSFVP